MEVERIPPAKMPVRLPLLPRQAALPIHWTEDAAVGIEIQHRPSEMAVPASRFILAEFDAQLSLNAESKKGVGVGPRRRAI
jgi:hypothetical protein